MARDMEQCRRCRRAGTKLFLKGERCFTPKCAVERRPYPPGDHGQGRQARKKVSDYGVPLREKQKLRRIYIVGGGTGSARTCRGQWAGGGRSLLCGQGRECRLPGGEEPGDPADLPRPFTEP